MEVIEELIAAPFVCLGWIIVGALAGAAANRLMDSRDQPILMDIILGWIGAIVGGFLVALIGIARPEGGLTAVLVSFIVATLGAVLLIGARRQLT